MLEASLKNTRLTETENLALQRYLSLITKEPKVYQISLFGSKAKGDVHEDSDVDIAVFVNTEYDNMFINRIINTASELLFEMGLLGEIFLRPTVIFNEDLLYNKRFVENILREGIMLWKEEKSYQIFRTS